MAAASRLRLLPSTRLIWRALLPQLTTASLLAPRAPLLLRLRLSVRVVAS
jgi:hypothetical protein